MTALIAWTGGAIWYGIYVVSEARNIASQDAAAKLAKSNSMFEVLANLLVGGGVGTVIVVWSVIFTPLTLAVIMAWLAKKSAPGTFNYNA